MAEEEFRLPKVDSMAIKFSRPAVVGVNKSDFGTREPDFTVRISCSQDALAEARSLGYLKCCGSLVLSEFEDQLQFVIPPQSKLAEGDYDVYLRYPMKMEFEFNGESMESGNLEEFDAVWLHSCFESVGAFNTLMKKCGFSKKDALLVTNHSVKVDATFTGGESGWRYFFYAVQQCEIGKCLALREIADKLFEALSKQFPNANFLYSNSVRT